jgi:energy-coupling factor transport system permease protein
VSAPGQLAFFPAYRPRASALHAAHAGVASAFCAALALFFVLFAHPLVVAAGLCAVVVAARGAGVGREVARAARLGVGIALLVALINPLLSSEGATVLVRGWALLGHRFDVTLEGVAYGVVAGVRLLGLVLACALFSAAVDPDEVLRSLRRVSYRSALTAALATRLVPVLARDATRRGEAARCRARPAPRVALARAALAGSLERAVEVAAALEVRGYGTARRGRAGGGAVGASAGRSKRRSRHDARVGASAAAIAVIAVAGALGGLAPFSAYPRLVVTIGPGQVALAAALVALAVAPFAGAPSRLGVSGDPGWEESGG